MLVRLAAVALVAGVGTVSAGAAETRNRTPPQGVTVPVKVNPEKGSTPRTFTPGAVVASGDDPRRMFAAGVELRSRRCGFFRSDDGGTTWSPGASPSPQTHPFCSHATQFMPMGALAIGGGGTVYYLHRAWSHQDNGQTPNSSIFLARTDDGGVTWKSATVGDGRASRLPNNELNFPADVVVDTTGPDDIVYVSWTATYPSSAPARPPQPLLAVSTDGGATFSNGVNISGKFFDDPANMTGDIAEAFKIKDHFGGTTPHLALDGGGALSISWMRRTVNLEPPPDHPRYLSRSEDRGRTFQVAELAPAGPVNEAGAPLDWTPGGGPLGTLHAVYEDKAGEVQGDRDVHYRRSVDGGRTWGKPIVLNDDDHSQLFTQLLPTVAVSPSGRLDVAWWDTRDALERYGTDVYFAYSADDGRSWSDNVRLTDRSVSRRFGSWIDNFGDTRQPPALSSSDALATVVWDDTRLGDEDAPLQDLYAASIQFAPLVERRSPATLQYTGAGLVGMLAGAGAVIVGRRRRLRRGATSGDVGSAV